MMPVVRMRHYIGLVGKLVVVVLQLLTSPSAHTRLDWPRDRLDWPISNLNATSVESTGTD